MKIQYYKGIKIVLLALLVGAAWLINLGHTVYGTAWLVIDAIFLVMVDIEIKEYENNLRI